MEDAIKSSVKEGKTLVPPSLRGGGRVDRWLFEKGPIEKASSVLLISCFDWWLVVSCLVGWLVCKVKEVPIQTCVVSAQRNFEGVMWQVRASLRSLHISRDRVEKADLMAHIQKLTIHAQTAMQNSTSLLHPP